MAVLDLARGSVEALAELIRRHGPAVVLTGAGVSTESGLPDFRSPGTGLWERIDPVEHLSAKALRRRPAEFWRLFAVAFAAGLGARPNAGHLALARLEAAGHVRSVVTQNIDGLHQAAGSRRVLEVHGSLRTASCRRCGLAVPLKEALDQLERREVPECTCGGTLRPDVVLFEDPMPPVFETAWREAASAGLLLVVGSSLTVWPAAGLAEVASRLAIINRDPTPYDGRAEVVLHAGSGQTLTELVRCLGVG
ncbi:MAG: NAD-dependent deacylase [Firmicutes bacterium]|nr:NAD-dependent deacylase [Bacillota bacterium]